MKNRTSRIAGAIGQCIMLIFVVLIATGSSAVAQNSTIFGPNVYVFTPSDSVSSINSTLTTLAGNTQFGTARAAVLFAPGTYTGVESEVGYYESVAGLGETPTAVNISQGYLTVNQTDSNGNLTTNFWRSIENMSMTVPAADNSTLQWGVSQGAAFRRMDISGGVELANTDCGESSGGFISDSVITGVLNACSQQQWYTRNSSIGSFAGYVWNFVFSGVSGAPAQSSPFGNDSENVQDTVLATTPVVREKPYLYIDSNGNYWVFSPSLRTNSTGTDWSNGGLGAGTSLPISSFYIATPSSTLAAINAALAAGQNLILTPGIYQYSGSINVTNANTVVLGLGYADLVPQTGTAALTVADVDGVQLAGFLIDAGPVNSPVLLQIGVNGAPRISHAANPTSISDVYFRIGGATAGTATTSMEIDSNNVILDNIWAWRADHGTDAAWTGNVAMHGLIVNGDNVTALGLAVEHYQAQQVLWNGENGETIFYQSEMPYDVPSQAAWMNGSVDGYASYNVAPGVANHTAYGLGVYSFFSQGINIIANSGIAAPVSSGVKFTDVVSVFLTGNGQITNTISSNNSTVDNAGTTVLSGNSISDVSSWGGTGGNCTAVPSTPGTPSASGTSASTISVAWSASTEGSSCTLSYNLFRSTTAGFTPSSSNMIASDLTAASFADSGLSSGTTYYYAVQAVNGDGSSANSAEGSGATTGNSTGTSGSPYGGTAAAIPGTVLAENYDLGGQGVGYSVSSVNGSDNAYRSDGVDLETTTATGGGNDIGWAAAGQWFNYTVKVATAGTYTVTFEVASNDGATDAFHLSNASGTNLTGSVNVPNTGGWQTWTTVTARVTLPAGTQVLTLSEDNADWNIYSAAFALALSSGSPYGGTAAAIPGTVLAENYDLGGQGVGYSVSSVNGSDNAYRSDGVDLETTTATGGGNDLGWTKAGQWFNYTVNVATAGTYTVTFEVASNDGATGAFHLSYASGTNLTGSVNVPNTGGWQTWTTVTATVTLPAGTQTLTLSEDNADWNIYSMQFASSGSGSGGGTSSGSGSGGSTSYTYGVTDDSTSLVVSFTGTPTCESVILSYILNSGAQLNVQMTASGSNFSYTIPGVTAGAAETLSYYFTYVQSTGSQFGPTTTYTWTRGSGGGGTTGDAPYGGTAAAVPGTVQAENYDTGGQGVAYNVTSTNGSANSYRSDGVDLEVTTDTSGGYDLGWTTAGQWFKYTVNVATAGTYTVTFRVAAPSAVSDAFHISNSSGTNLSGAVAVPATGGWQTWTSVTATVTLPAGQQTLTFNQDTAGWNLNWLSFASSGGTTGTGNCSSVSAMTVGSTTYTPQFCQEFNGTAGSPDTTVWNFDLGNNGGWGNNEVEVYCGPPGYSGNPSQCPTTFSTSTAPVYIDGNGHLVIQPINENGTWISGRMNTEGKENFQYGIIEASIQVPNTTGQGLWPAFWSLGSNIGSVGWPTCGESDFMEDWSTQVDGGPGIAGVRSTIHTALTGGDGVGDLFSFPSGQASDTAYHTYGIIWTANEMQFFVDNPATPFFTVTPSSLPSGDTWPFNADLFLLLNVAVGGTLGGSTADLTNPQPMMVDYVRYYTAQ